MHNAFFFCGFYRMLIESSLIRYCNTIHYQYVKLLGVFMFTLINKFVCPKCGKSEYLEGKNIILCICGYRVDFIKA